MLLAILIFAIVVLSSRCDSLRDRNFANPRWRLPLALLGADLWHLVKWGSFYPPLIACCWLGYGPPWQWPGIALWPVTTAAAWIAWAWGSPWPSFWTRKLR